MKTTQLILCSLLGFAAAPALACYTVLDREDRVVYQSQNPPVDMSRPIHETLPSRYPGGHLIFQLGTECPVISSVAAGRGDQTQSSTAPLLTNRRTAEAMNLPHRVMQGDIALVSPRAAVLTPGVTVVPAQAVAQGRSPTSVMGAGSGRGAVITEMRDPPVTIEQSRGRVILRDAGR